MKTPSFLRKYWFAIGYHQVLSHQNDPPSDEYIDYFKDVSNIDILKEYYEGRKSGEKDLKNGIY